MTTVQFQQVSKLWGKTAALHPTDLTLNEGDFSVLLGPSGCGKTTTLRLIAGLETPSSGEIRIFDRAVTNQSPAARGISMVFQNYALFPHLSVAENVAFGLRVRKMPKADIEARLKKPFICSDSMRYARANHHNSRVASNNASHLPAPWWLMPDCVSWTSPYQISTPNYANRCARNYALFNKSLVYPWSTSRMTKPRP